MWKKKQRLSLIFSPTKGMVVKSDIPLKWKNFESLLKEKLDQRYLISSYLLGLKRWYNTKTDIYFNTVSSTKRLNSFQILHEIVLYHNFRNQSWIDTSADYWKYRRYIFGHSCQQRFILYWRPKTLFYPK